MLSSTIFMLSAEAAFTKGPVALFVSDKVNESVSNAMESVVSSRVSEESCLPPQEHAVMLKQSRNSTV